MALTGEQNVHSKPKERKLLLAPRKVGGWSPQNIEKLTNFKQTAILDILMQKVWQPLANILVSVVIQIAPGVVQSNIRFSIFMDSTFMALKTMTDS